MNQTTDLRIQKTYLALHTAFTELLENQHFEDFTVNELCNRAMIRRATFYKHFADKYDYFSFYAKELVAGFQAQLPQIPQNDANEYLLYMCKQLLQFMKQHKKLVLNIKNSTVFHMLLYILVEQTNHDVFQALRQSDLHKDLDKKAITGTYQKSLSKRSFLCKSGFLQCSVRTNIVHMGKSFNSLQAHGFHSKLAHGL